MAFSLKKYNTFGLDVSAEKGFVITDDALFSMAFREIERTGLPYLVLGEGSDVLFTCDFKGIVLINRLQGFSFNEDANNHYVTIRSGENFHNAILTLRQRGIYGLENLALIPGTVGASPVQNFGAYGVCLADFCEYVMALDLQSKDRVKIMAKDCQFGYRHSMFKQPENRMRYIITDVCLKISKTEPVKASYSAFKNMNITTHDELFEAVCKIRSAKLPNPQDLGSAGSFFKNPIILREQAEELLYKYPDMPVYPVDDKHVKIAAGWLIDKAGCKGLKLGNAGTYHNQALILVNYGHATPNEILDVAIYIHKKVLEMYGINLEPEVRIYGRDGECKL